MKYLSIFIISIIFVCCSQPVIDDDPKSLVVGTYNIQWLGDGKDDQVTRASKDYMNIAYQIESSEAEIFGLQEIENEDAVKKLIEYLPNWNYKFIDNGTKQNLCFIFKNYIKINKIELIENLEVEKSKTRKASIVSFAYANEEINIINVHLKSTSRYDDTPEKLQRSYELRNSQAIELNNISKLYNNEKKNMIVLGDFNDNPNRNSKSQISILEDNLYFPTKELKSCKAFYFDCIDHIAINYMLKDNLEPNSQLIIDSRVLFKEEELKMISDHCPVIIKLNF